MRPSPAFAVARGALWMLVGCVAGGCARAPATRLPAAASLGDGMVALTRDGATLEIRTTDARGLVHVYVRAGDALYVLHASASLGSAEYRRSHGAWRRVHDFAWSCRAPEPLACHDAFFAREHWDANPIPPAQPGGPRHFRVDLAGLAPGRAVDLAVVRYVYPGDIATWPASLRDDARNESLLRGTAPPTVTLDFAGWAHLPRAPK
jgi:hypothetical protein